jgi:glycosyltransferase involved in cell wall biosynthesis
MITTGETRGEMRRPIRLTVVMTHPAQYMSPWFRHIAAQRTDIELTVLYGAIPDAEQQGVGFGAAFTWDVPLTEGYRFEVCGEARGKSFDSDSFRGIDVPDIGEHITRTNPDVVLVAGWHSIMQVRALRACRRRGIPVIYRGDSTLFSGPRGLLRPLWSLKSRRMLQRFDGYLSVGTHAREYLRACGVADPLIASSPHCVDNDRFATEAERLRRGDGRAAARRAIGAADGDFVVLFAGKFQERKRPIDAVRAVARLRPGAVLMMAGDGPLRDRCRAEAERLGVRVAWAGFLNQSELPSAFAAADCLLVPSTWESWGLIVNEALASGVPCVVTSRVAAAADLIVEGETGHVVDALDVEAMAERLAAVRTRAAAGHDFAPRCREVAATCSFAAATNGLADLCRRIVVNGAAPAAPTRVVACCGAMVSVFGLELSTFELLGGLREHGASVRCIVNSWDSWRIADLAAANRVRWSPGYYLAPFRLRGISPRQAAYFAWDILRVSATLLRVAWHERATHVLIPDMGAAVWNLPALALLRLLGVKVVCRLGNAPDAQPRYRFLWGRLINPVTTQFLPNSQFTADALQATGVPTRKMRIVRNTPPSRAPYDLATVAKVRGRIVFAGQLIPAKGCDRLLDALAILVRRGHDATLDIIGDTARWEPENWRGYIASLQERAVRPDIRGRVHFLGWRDDVPALLAAGTVHCFPSRIETREGFGLVSVEAKAAGVPSVVAPSGALPEAIVHGEDGWVCADDSAEALAEGLEFFLSNPQRAADAGARALASSVQFSRERRIGEWLDAFDMNRGGGGRNPIAPATGALHSHAD